MKSRKMMFSLLAIAMMAVVVAFSACGGSKDKSDACDITKFTVAGKDFTITGTNIAGIYEKTGPDAWSAVGSAPTIVFSEKASISPLPTVGQDFTVTGGVKYTVTAESGKTQVYTVTATKQPNLD
jgi:hypothetical protein